jgi:hypothetical protein
VKLIPSAITDHAVVRYLERVRGVDIDAVRREIAARVATGLEAGACGVLVEGMEYRIENGHVVTVQKARYPDKRTGKVRRERPDPEGPDHA